MKQIRLLSGADISSVLSKRSIRPILIVLMAALTFIATTFTGFIIYESSASRLTEDAWQRQSATLDMAVAAVDRQWEEICSFSWQLSENPRLVPLMYVNEKTAETTLAKYDMMETLKSMKAYSNTTADIALCLTASESVVTAESSMSKELFYSRLPGTAENEVESVRALAGGTALAHYVNQFDIQRIITTEKVLLFVTDLPVGRRSGLGYLLFSMKTDKLRELLPTNGAGALLLTDRNGIPLTNAADKSELYSEICQAASGRSISRMDYNGNTYSVLQKPTAVDGLYCAAVIPLSEILAPANAIRNSAMLIMFICLIVGIAIAVLVTRWLYAPIEGILEALRRLGHVLPEGEKRNELALLGDAFRLLSEQNKELRLSNKQVQRLLKNRALKDYVEGRLGDRQAEVLHEAGISIRYTHAQVAVIEMDAQSQKRICQGIQGDIADWLEARSELRDHGAMDIHSAQIDDRRYLILFSMDTGHPHPETLYDYLEQCRLILSGYAPLRIAVGRMYPIGEASSSIIDALMALRSDTTNGENAILPAEEIAVSPGSEYSLDMEQRLINYTLSMQKHEVNALLDELCLVSEHGDNAVPILRRSLSQALLFTARRALKQSGIEDMYQTMLEKEGLQLDDAVEQGNTLQSIRSVYDAVMNAIGQSRSTQGEQLYHRLCEYVKNEYMHDISLDTASEALGLSPSYIGLIFRRSGNTTFARSVNDMRISHAKRLLVDTELSVSEIGRHVGMENQNTFIRAFKKAEGVTPGQYRLSKTATDCQN